MSPREPLDDADQQQHAERDGEQADGQRGRTRGVTRLEMAEDRNGGDLRLERDVAADEDDRAELTNRLREREAAAERVAVRILVAEDQDVVVCVEQLLDLVVKVGDLGLGGYVVSSWSAVGVAGSTSLSSSAM